MSLLDDIRVDYGDDDGIIPSGLSPSGITPVFFTESLLADIRVDYGDDDGIIPSGTFISGVQVHNLLSTVHGDTTPASPNLGDLILGGLTWSVLPSGDEGQVLSISGGQVIWAIDSAGASGLAAHAANPNAHHVRYTDSEASGIAVQVATTGIANHAGIIDAHHTRYTDAEAIIASSGALDHHFRYTDAEASGVAVQVATSGIEEAITNHIAVTDAHHTRYIDAEAIAASSGALDHHVRYTDAEASGIAVQVAITGIANHAAITDIHHARYTDTEASGIAVQVATSGIEEAITNHTAVSDAHHARYTDAEASGIAVQVATTGITEHAVITDAHHTRYTDAEAIVAATGSVTLQTAYDVSPSIPQIVLTTDPIIIRDNAAPLTSAFGVQNNAGTIDLLKVFGTVGGRQVELGAHDSLLSSAGNQPIVRIGDLSSSFEFWPTDRTFTSSPGSLMIFNGAYEYNYANNSFAALNLQATISIRQSQFVFNGFLLFNNGLTIKNVNGVAANFGPGQTFIAQPTIQADGASISMGQNRDFLSQPNFNTISGGSLSVGTWGQVQLFGQINTGVTMTNRNAIQIGALIGAGGTLTNERGIRLENLNRGATIIGFDSALTGTSKTFINHPGNSPSNFGGDIRISNGISLGLGTVGNNGVELLRSAAGTMRMIGINGTNNEALEWDFDTPTANNIEINSSTNAGLQFNLDAISFGTTAADPTSANWFTIFTAPNLRQPSAGGEYSDVLWTAGGTLDINGLAMTNVQGFKINAPAVILNGGSIDDLSNLFVDSMPSFGATRLQALRVRGRTRLDGLVTYNHAVSSTLTASVSGLTLPPNNNGRHMILMDADASGPWIVQGVVNDQVGDSVYIMNSGVNDFIIGHQDAGSAPSERIISPTSSGITLSQHQMVKLWYNSTLSRWNILEHTGI